MDEPDTLRGSPSLGRVKELDELKDNGFSEAERIALEGSVWRKLDRWVLPVCTIFYLLSFLVCFVQIYCLHHSNCRGPVGQEQHLKRPRSWIADVLRHV